MFVCILLDRKLCRAEPEGELLSDPFRPPQPHCFILKHVNSQFKYSIIVIYIYIYIHYTRDGQAAGEVTTIHIHTYIYYICNKHLI